MEQNNIEEIYVLFSLKQLIITDIKIYRHPNSAGYFCYIHVNDYPKGLKTNFVFKEI